MVGITILQEHSLSQIYDLSYIDLHDFAFVGEKVMFGPQGLLISLNGIWEMWSSLIIVSNLQDHEREEDSKIVLLALFPRYG